MIKDATWRGISVRRAMSFIDLKKKKDCIKLKSSVESYDF